MFENIQHKVTCIQRHLIGVFYLWLINNELQIHGICNTLSTAVVPLCQEVHLYVQILQQMNSGNSRRDVPKQRKNLTKENSSYVVKVFRTTSHAKRSRTPLFQSDTDFRFTLFTNILFPAGARDFSLLQSV
jgi:hypothetical protein